MTQPANKYAPTAWGAPKLVDLEVPSGQLCQVHPPGVEQLIAAGVLENVDTLTSLIDKKHIKRVQGKALPGSAAARKAAPVDNDDIAMPDGSVVSKASLLQDQNNLVKVFGLVDRITVVMVVQPQVLPVPEDPALRVPMAELIENGQVYTDMIDMMDKMYIFQYAVGGGTDLEQFRQQFASGMGSLAPQ